MLPIHPDHPPEPGPLAAAISSSVVRLFSEHTGRGPTQAKTTIDGDLVIVVLRETMTKAERVLVGAGRNGEVLGMRRAFQETMRGDLVEVVERYTGREVRTFMSTNNTRPDAAAEVFLLDGDVDVAEALGRLTGTTSGG